MVLPSLVLAMLAAAPVKVAAPGFNAVDVDPKRADFLVDYFADQLTSHGGVRVTTKSEIAALIGMERQKQLLGCGEGSSQCLAELAGALGVDALIVGNVVKVGRGFAATVKIVHANSAEPIASASNRFDDEGRLLDWMREIAPGFAERVRAAFGGANASTSPAPGASGATGVVPERAGGSRPVTLLSGDPPRLNRFILGTVGLGFERWLSDVFALGFHAYGGVGPRFLWWPQFTIGLYGGPYARARLVHAGPFELSTLLTVGYGAAQDYYGPTIGTAGVLGFFAAPALELSVFRFGLTFEAPLFFFKTFGQDTPFFLPVFSRLTYAFEF